MEVLFNIKIVLLLYFLQICIFRVSDGAACRGLSADSKCQCDRYGRCIPGTVEIDSWLQIALKTQRELQIDFRLDEMQIFAAHNAFNNRASGLIYGANDTCQWPPPYDNPCLGIANHEFSIIDQFNMGIRSVELDTWFCEEKLRVAHTMNVGRIPLCGRFNKLYADVIAEIGQWLDEPGHENDFIKIYLNEGAVQGTDADVNAPLERYIGHDHILSPADLRDTYGGVWPTLRRMVEDEKRAYVITSGSVHQGKYIHESLCTGSQVKEFSNYPQCGGKTPTNCRRFYGDSTHYVSSLIYDGPTSAGVITDLSELVKCGINFPCTDMVTPQLMTTGVFTWAHGEPSLDLNENTCVLLNYNDNRWYTSANCDQSLSYACQNLTNSAIWTISDETGPYDVTRNLCPIGYKFSVPHNGYRQQKLKEAMKGKSVWLNYTPWITGVFPTTEATPEATPTSKATTLSSSGSISIVITLSCLLAISAMFVDKLQ